MSRLQRNKPQRQGAQGARDARYRLPLAAVLRAATAMAMLLVAVLGAGAQTDRSVKAERLHIRDGNAAYNAGEYQKALVCYEMALNENPLSELAQFNRAVTITRLSNGQDSVMQQAVQVLQRLGASATDTSLKEKANYNLGNMAFNRQDYGTSIEQYKKVLRSNPSNTKARENLRVAQLKLQSQDQNQNQDQDQQDQQDQQQEQEQQPQPQQQPQQQNNSADQILQSMQNRENQTRRDVEKREMQVGVPVTDKPW